MNLQFFSEILMKLLFPSLDYSVFCVNRYNRGTLKFNGFIKEFAVSNMPLGKYCPN